MIDLSCSGLPLAWDEEKEALLFGPGVEEVKPSLRRVGDMEEILYEPEILARGSEAPERPLYYMYRDVHRLKDRPLFRRKGIRYDITVLVPGQVGSELVKTVGHYHPRKPGTFFTYPEVYEVLYGQACYLFQRLRTSEPEDGVDQAVAVKAGPGDKVLIPSGFGHITVNIGPGYLVMSNLVADNFGSLYAPLTCMRGGCYFKLAAPQKEGGSRFVRNPCYPQAPPLRICLPVELPSYGLLRGLSQYTSFIRHPNCFDFLTRPEEYQEEFRTYLLALQEVCWQGAEEEG